jgi:hypothetical protein
VRTTLQRPFTGSIVTDEPAYRLRPSDKPFAQDGYSPQGLFTGRRGWAYDGTTADAAVNLASVHRSQYLLADLTRTVTCDVNGVLRIHNASSAGTTFRTETTDFLPRCVYRDELILCAQDGLTPLLRYSGASTVSIAATGDELLSSGTASVYNDGGGSWASTPEVGMFFQGTRGSTGTNWNATITPRIISVTTDTRVTLEGIQAGSSTAFSASGPPAMTAVGHAFPAVSIYESGTATASGTGATGNGTKWSSDLTIRVRSSIGPDALLLLTPSAPATMGDITEVTSDTALVGSFNTQATASPARIMRRCPFKDAAAHQNSLWGTGVAQYPSRVYVFPPGWNPAFPPGFIEPFNPQADLSSSNANDFFADFIDVPSSYDGDDNVAILTSPGPLLVLKRNSVYGVSGSFPSFSTDLIADGIGCIDIRSAHSYDEGQFFAGENGIYWYTGGRFIDLTAGKINREWRSLTRDFDYGVNDYCTLGVSSGHLWVHITTNAGATTRTYICDLRDQSWQSRVTNVSPRYMFTSRIPGEKEKLLAVQDIDQGRVIDLAPCLDGSGTAKDDDGTSPRMQAWTPENLDGRSLDEDTRLLDLAIHANVYDAGAAGSTSMAVSVVSQDALTAEATATKTLTDIDSDPTDRLDRHYFRHVNRRGRRHQIRLDVDTVGTDDTQTKVEIAEIDVSFRNSRDRT